MMPPEGLGRSLVLGLDLVRGFLLLLIWFAPFFPAPAPWYRWLQRRCETRLPRPSSRVVSTQTRGAGCAASALGLPGPMGNADEQGDFIQRCF